MKRSKYEPPTAKFPFKIAYRLDQLSRPKRYYTETRQDLPAYSKAGVRVSAISGRSDDRAADIAWPWLRKLILTKRMYKNKFSQERIQRLDRMIEAANATQYSKLANCAIDTKKHDFINLRKKKPWTESEWKKHMEHINQMAAPKKECEPTPIKRGGSRPLSTLMPRIKDMAVRPEFKCYKRMSQEDWYKEPMKVSPNALKYNISDRMKKLAKPRVRPQQF